MDGFFGMQKLESHDGSSLILFALTSIMLSKDLVEMNRKAGGL